MKKQYQIQNLDCAHCAMKIEEAASKLDGVILVKVNFSAMKLTLEAEDSEFPRVFKSVQKLVHRMEPDVKLRESRTVLNGFQYRDMWEIIVAVVLFAAAMVLVSSGVFAEGSWVAAAAFLPSYLLAGYGVLKKAFIGLFGGRVFDENFLMAIATFGAFAIGETSEGVMVMLLYRIGEFFQSLAVSRSRKSITDLMDIRPDKANLLDKNGTITEVHPDLVEIESLILIKPGEKIPLDGIVVEGSSFLDTAAINGESRPKEVAVGDAVTSGCINMNGALTVKTQKSFGESTVSKILSLIEDSGDNKSKTEKFITRFARYYTPIVVLLAVVLAVVTPLFTGEWELWIHKAITCVVISCPCALVISVPLAFFGGIGGAGKQGILIKGADSVERLAKAGSVAFDKTGTLTRGDFSVTAIHPEVMSESELLELAATCENYSDHPVSRSLKAAFDRDVDKGSIGRIEEFFGEGVAAEIKGKKYFVGNEKLMERAGAVVRPCKECAHHGTLVHVSEGCEYLGHILVSDRLRPDAKQAISDLRSQGVEDFYILSGDDTAVAAAVADELGVKNVFGSLLPQDKHRILEELKATKAEGNSLVFVGDGINDTPVLTKADVGIAMGRVGADAAMEAADVVLMDDKPSKVAKAIAIAKKTLSIVRQNIIMSVGIKLFVLVPNITMGHDSIPVWLAIFADVGVCILAIINSTRALHTKK